MYLQIQNLCLPSTFAIQSLEIVEKFVHLSSCVKVSHEINRRRMKTILDHPELDHLSSHPDVLLTLKGRFSDNASVTALLLYACEVWSPS